MRHTIKNKAFAILFMAMLLSPSALAKNDWSIPLAICYNKNPIIDGINRPSRTPYVNDRLTLEVSYDTSNCQLEFSDAQEQIYYYVVVNENDVVQSEGYLDFRCQDCIYVTLNTLRTGSYTIFIFHTGYELIGSFDIE